MNASTDSQASGLKAEQNTEAEWESDNRTRAALYNLFAAAMARKIDETWLNPGFEATLRGGLPDSAGKDLVLKAIGSARTDRKWFDEVQLDFDALFIVPGPKLIFPYESCYTHRNVDGTFGRLWQEPAQDMHRFLKEWEIEFAEGWDLIPDHIAVELSFMGNLCRLVSQRAGNEEEIQRILGWQEQIFINHLGPWVFELLGNMERKAETDFYRGLAKLLHAFLQEESEALVKE